MNKRFFTLILVFITTGLISISAQEEWILDGNKSMVFSSLVDSITYTNENGSYFENQWFNGEVTNKELIEEYDFYRPHTYKLDYSYCTLQEDGVDAIATDNGLYATLQFSPDSTHITLIVGDLKDNDNFCLVFDSIGRATTIITSDNDIYRIVYASNELLVFDEEGDIIGEIPYTKFEEDNGLVKRNNIRKVYGFTQNPIYKAASIFSTIIEFITAKKPRKEIVKQILASLIKGAGNREIDLWTDLLTAGINPFSWIEFFETMDEFSWFENATITTLDAIEKKCNNFTLPCKIDNFKPLEKVLGLKLAKFMNLKYDYKLKMTADNCSERFMDHQMKSRTDVEKSGKYSFDFTFKYLNTVYEYEPSLVLTGTYDFEMEIPLLTAEGYIGNNYDTYTKIKHGEINCKIKGDKNYLTTGKVNSFVQYVENVKVSSADIICSFSYVPAGAKCYVTIAEYGSDITVNYEAISNKANQTIHVTGLAANTDYIANTVIIYNGEMFGGENMVGFTTEKPEGKVISVDDETITMTSAIAKCEFKGIEAGTEVGVIVNPSSIGKFIATSKDGEQYVEMTNLEPCTTYECFAYIKTANHYEEQTNRISFTTKGANLSGEWIGAIYDTDMSILETIKLTLKENKDVIIESLGGTSFVPATEVGTWRVYERDKASIHFGWGAGTWNPVYYGETFSGTLDDAYNPKKISGTVYRGWAGLSEHGNTYVFELSKK